MADKNWHGQCIYHRTIEQVGEEEEEEMQETDMQQPNQPKEEASTGAGHRY